MRVYIITDHNIKDAMERALGALAEGLIYATEEEAAVAVTRLPDEDACGKDYKIESATIEM